jgi:integrase
MSRGTIIRRGKASWRLKFDVPSDTPGQRETKYVTVRGKRADAERELTRLLAQHDAGTFVEPSRIALRDYLRSWLDGRSDISAKTRERYAELIAELIAPHLGKIPLQSLKPQRIAQWHDDLLKSGGKNGRPLSARTVGHAHRVLRAALERAVKLETLSRNVASVVPPPKVSAPEIEILDAQQIAIVLERLEGHRLFPIVSLALATGLRRGELLALRLSDLSFDQGSLRVERTLEEMKDGSISVKAPKSKAGRRTLALPQTSLDMLREHRRELLQNRLLLGMGKPDDDTLLFSNLDGSPRRPSNLTISWLRACAALDLPRVSFHALRHTHASALIAAKLDIVRISRRLGHSKPSITLDIYAHLFDTDDREAASAMDALMGSKSEQ